MVFICSLSKHGASHQDNTNGWAEAADTIITFILAFFNFRISIKTVSESGLHFSPRANYLEIIYLLAKTISPHL